MWVDVVPCAATWNIAYWRNKQGVLHYSGVATLEASTVKVCVLNTTDAWDALASPNRLKWLGITYYNYPVSVFDDKE